MHWTDSVFVWTLSCLKYFHFSSCFKKECGHIGYCIWLEGGGDGFNVLSQSICCRSAIFGHLARLGDEFPAHKALHSCVKLSQGRLPDPTWKRRPGRPHGRWIDQLQKDNNRPPADQWKLAIRRGHGGRATLRSNDYATTWPDLTWIPWICQKLRLAKNLCSAKLCIDWYWHRWSWTTLSRGGFVNIVADVVVWLVSKASRRIKPTLVSPTSADVSGGDTAGNKCSSTSSSMFSCVPIVPAPAYAMPRSVWAHVDHKLHTRRRYYRVYKRATFTFLWISLVKHGPILIFFSMQHHQESAWRTVVLLTLP